MRNLLLTILLVVAVAGCHLPNEPMVMGKPSWMPDGKWVSFSWYTSCGGDIRGGTDYGVGNGYELIAKLNSKQYIHERYMSKIRIPALTQKEWQDNNKAVTYWIGKYGVLPK